MPVREIAARGRVPVIVGGTGLYLRALFHGLFEVPTDPEVRDRLQDPLPCGPPFRLRGARAARPRVRPLHQPSRPGAGGEGAGGLLPLGCHHVGAGAQSRVPRRAVRGVQDRSHPGKGRAVREDRKEGRPDAPPGMGGGGRGSAAALSGERQALPVHRLPGDRASPDGRHRPPGDGRGHKESDAPLCEAADSPGSPKKRA